MNKANKPLQLSRNAVKRICESDQKIQEEFTLQVIDVKTFEQKPDQKAKIHSKYKISDGVSIIHAMVLEQIAKKMQGPVPTLGVIQFQGYMKNKVNNKHLIIFAKPPKLVATPHLKIGEPLEYEKRLEKGDFSSNAAELEKIDIDVPVKQAVLQPMDSFDNEEATKSTDYTQKLNNKDLQLMNNNNPEEQSMNPFNVGKIASQT